MVKFFTRKYQPARILILLAIGGVTVLVARARHIQFQQPHVHVAPAPELTGTEWINADKPISLASRRGKVTMVEFWTFACSNCAANLPIYEDWQKRFSPQGFSIVSVHTPELAIERDPKNVRKFVTEHGITYPVLLDRDQRNWTRWHEQFWPSIYLVDKKGNIRDHWVGELNSMGSGGEGKLTDEIEELLRE